MKNVTTPRTLSECSFVVGYRSLDHSHHRRESVTERAAGVVLAVVCGVMLALALAHWWSA